MYALNFTLITVAIECVLDRKKICNSSTPLFDGEKRVALDLL